MINEHEFEKAQNLVNQKVSEDTRKLSNDQADVKRIDVEIPQTTKEITILEQQIREKRSKISQDKLQREKDLREINMLEREIREIHQKQEKFRSQSIHDMHAAGVKGVRPHE